MPTSNRIRTYFVSCFKTFFAIASVMYGGVQTRFRSFFCHGIITCCIGRNYVAQYCSGRSTKRTVSRNVCRKIWQTCYGFNIVIYLRWARIEIKIFCIPASIKLMFSNAMLRAQRASLNCCCTKSVAAM
jgi:hypothetical protein